MARSTTPKTQPSDASVAEFVAAVPDAARRADCQTLIDMLGAATGAAPRLWGSSIVGFGAYRLEYADGREAAWPLIGFSPRKQDLTLYLMPGFAGAEALLGRLGPHRTGKSCLYLKRLSDVDRATLEALVLRSVEAMASRRIDAPAVFPKPT